MVFFSFVGGDFAQCLGRFGGFCDFLVIFGMFVIFVFFRFFGIWVKKKIPPHRGPEVAVGSIFPFAN